MILPSAGKYRSFRGRLLLLLTLTAAVAVTSVCVLLLWLEYGRTMQQASMALDTRADVLAINLQAPLMFDDRDTAQETLASMRADPHIAAAVLYGKDGVFSSYLSGGAPPRDFNPSDPESRPRGRYLVVVTPVAHDGEVVGRLMLIQDMRPAFHLFWINAGLAMLVSCGVTVMALLLAMRMETALTRPIADLAKVASRVSQTGDFRQRAPVSGYEELASFTVVFNEMLGRVESQTAELAAAGERFRLAVESAPTAMVMADKLGRIVLTNGLAEKLFGYSHQEMVGQPVEMLIPERFRGQHPGFRDSFMGSPEARPMGVGRDLFGLRKDGSEFPVEIGLSPFKTDQGLRVMAGIVDITERVRAQEALRRSERLYRAVGESLDFGVWVCDDEGKNIYASDSFLKLVGLTQEECSSFGWGAVLHPDEVQPTMAAWKACVRDHCVWDREMRYRGVDGKYHPVLARGVLVRDEDGKPLCWAGVNADVSKLKEAEDSLRQLNETLEQRVAERSAEAEERAAQLRALAAELTSAEERERRRLAHALHDNLQQVLVAAKMRLSVVSRQSKDQNIRNLLTQVGGLIDDSVSICRSVSLELTPPVLYDAGLGAALQWLARHMLEKHGLVVTVDADPKMDTLSDEVQPFLFQAARELLFNVVKHAGVSEAKVRLTLKGEMVSLTIEDHGAGMGRPIDRSQNATGFGLFSIRERLQYLGGEFDVDSTPGTGTRVTLLAPRRRGSGGPSNPRGRSDSGLEPRPTPRGNLVRVLLADDHQIVREGVAQLLREHGGFDIVGEAINGQEAIDLALRLQPDVVIMDVTMPVLSGIEATRRIVSLMPHMRVVGLSMHGQHEMEDRMREAGASAYLTKGGPAEVLIEQILRVAAAK